jgi:ATP-dependent RNA helicase RhlE
MSSQQILEIIEPLKRALREKGYPSLTPIQKKAIPVVLKGRDLLGVAQTGTGKTAAFALPIIQRIYNKQANPDEKKVIQALILTPTRELACQIGDSFEAYGQFTDIKHAVVFGGVSKHFQIDALNRGVDVLIATPGRLIDLMGQVYINFHTMEIFVLDEADRMLDMGFIDDIRQILSVLPEKKQSLFFSATMPPEIVKLSSTILNNPIKVEVTPPSSTVNTIQQAVYFVHREDKNDLLVHLLRDKTIENALVFTKTKLGAEKVSNFLKRKGIRAEALHSDKTQDVRQLTLNNFKNKEIRVLVATDIASRGIDIDDLSHVINYEIPNVPETYVHRIGRTGRAGASGVSLSFCDSSEKQFLLNINHQIGKWIPEVENHPFNMY